MVISNLSGEKIIYPDVKIQSIGFLKRFKKTVLTLAKTGGITFLFTFIPILHFILVPVGLLVTVLSTWASWKQSYYLPLFDTHCPSCDKKSIVTLQGAALPLRTYCPHCRNLISLSNS